jgi:3-oxoacyl-[acyl-carrier-protein] synthase III
MEEPRIVSLAVELPERVVTNEDMARIVDTSDEWIVSHTGIRERRHVEADQATSDLGIAAGRKALEAAEIPGEEIDLVICATSTSDYPNFPATACIIQDALGLKNAGAFDLLAGCTGFVYGLENARAFLKAGLARSVLLVGAEVLSKLSNMEDRNTCILFGDGAGAVVMSHPDISSAAPTRTDTLGGARPRVIASWLRSRGSGAEALLRRAGGTRNPYVEGKTDPAHMTLEMNGRDVYMFAVDAIVQSIRNLLEQADLSMEQVTRIVPHQANVRIIEAAAKRLKIPVDRFFVNIEAYANTSAASIPLALNDMVTEGLVAPGDTILTVGFGAGLTYGGNVISW